MIGVCVICYKRKEHFERLISSIKSDPSFNSSEFKLYIFQDGAKESNQGDLNQVNELSEYISQLDYEFIKRDMNYGLYKNVINSINYVLTRHSKIIVLEEDLVIKGGFFHYIKTALHKYELFEDIFQISGYAWKNNSHSPYFMNITTTWGWGTWRDRWNKINFPKKTIDLIHKKKFTPIKKIKFNQYESYPFYRILRQQDKNLKSWGIFFYLHSYENNRLTLYPPVSYINNQGQDGSGEHKETLGLGHLEEFESKTLLLSPESFPERISRNKLIQTKMIFDYYLKFNMINKIIRHVKATFITTLQGQKKN